MASTPGQSSALGNSVARSTGTVWRSSTGSAPPGPALTLPGGNSPSTSACALCTVRGSSSEWIKSSEGSYVGPSSPHASTKCARSCAPCTSSCARPLAVSCPSPHSLLIWCQSYTLRYSLSGDANPDCGVSLGMALSRSEHCHTAPSFGQHCVVLEPAYVRSARARVSGGGEGGGGGICAWGHTQRAAHLRGGRRGGPAASSAPRRSAEGRPAGPGCPGRRRSNTTTAARRRPRPPSARPHAGAP
jgi:hypothetical protein